MSVAAFANRCRQDGYIEAEDGTRLSISHAIPHEEGLLLQHLVRELDAKVVVEIGMALGVSSLYIAEALRDLGGTRRYIATDPFQSSHWHHAGLQGLRRHKLDTMVEFHERFSHHLLPELEQKGLSVDLAFVDGNHFFDYALMDFLLIDRILRIGGIIVFDDVCWPSVRKVLRYILTNRAYSVRVATGARLTPYEQNLGEKLAFAFGRFLAPVGLRVLASEFTHPSWDLGLRSRFVVIQKNASDTRDYRKEMFHNRF